MADRGKVIKGLEWILNDIEENGHYQVGYYADEIQDALALLREQEPVIVRCKNCRHYNTECCTDGYGWCECRNFGTNDEWYCADGEVK